MNDTQKRPHYTHWSALTSNEVTQAEQVTERSFNGIEGMLKLLHSTHNTQPWSTRTIQLYHRGMVKSRDRVMTRIRHLQELDTSNRIYNLSLVITYS